MLSPPAIDASPALFCGQCGMPLEETSCLHCAAAPPSSPAIANFHSLPSWRGIAGTLKLYFTLLLVCCGVTLLYAAEGESLRPSDEVEIACAASILLAIITLLFCITGWRLVLPSLSRFGPARYYLLAPLLALGTFALAASIVAAAQFLLGAQAISHLEPFILADAPLWLPFLLVCIQPAIFEELAFRGYITESLAASLSRRELLFVTAFLFAFLHLSPLAFIHLAVIGLVLGHLRARSGSLYPCMLLHGCHNGLVLLSEYLLWRLQ